MKKRGQLLGDITLWLYKILITVIVLGIIYGVINFFITRDFNINESIADMLIRRLYYSESCFALEDITVEPGVIDIKKFNELRLKNCLATQYPIKVKLEKLGKIISNTIEYNDNYNLCQVQSKKKKCLFIGKQNVLVVDNGIKTSDVLNVEVIIK